MTSALGFRWSGEAMIPLAPKRADAEFVVGEVYVLEAVEERSAASHRHFFASVREGWSNLSEADREVHPNPEALRKYCLIKAGFCDCRKIVVSNRRQAEAISETIRHLDRNAVIAVEGASILVFTAHSQSMKAMGKDTFEASKTAVLAQIATMIGTTADELQRAGRAEQ